MEGKVVQGHKPGGRREILELDLGDHPAGLYMVLISAEEGTFIQKLVLKN